MENNSIYSVDQQQGINGFIARSLLWMIGGLIISALLAYYLLMTPSLLRVIFGNSLANYCTSVLGY